MTRARGDSRNVRPAARVAALVVLAGLASACRGGPTADRAATTAAPAAVPVRTAPASGGAGGFAEVPGSIEAAESAAIASRMAAEVLEVRAEIGDVVGRGAILVRLDDRDLSARVRSAEAALRAAASQQERMRALHGREAATSREVESAEAAAAAATAEYDAASAQLAYATLRAPFNGRVTDRRIHPGDLAVPGQPLLILQGGGTLRATATVTREMADRLTLGDAVTVEREGGAAVEARLTVISPAGDPASRRILIKADLPPGAGLREGAFVRIRLPATVTEAPVLVPRSAVVERGALTTVFVVRDGRAWLRYISPGAGVGDAVEARAGLRSGERVVLDPRGIADGTPVMVTDAP